MTEALFQEYLENWDKKLQKSGRKILVLVDNCSAHVEVTRLRQIKLAFFPPNLTSVIQPMDLGVIKNFKTTYRQLLMEKILSTIDDSKVFPKITLLDAVNLASLSWHCVAGVTISNCYRHAKLTSEDDDVLEIESFLARGTDDILNEFFNQFPDRQPDGDFTMADYVGVDEEVQICEVPTDASLIPAIIQPSETVTDDQGESEDESDVQVLHEAILYSKINGSLEVLKNFIYQENLPSELHFHISAIENAVLERKICKRTQAKITDYF